MVRDSSCSLGEKPSGNKRHPESRAYENTCGNCHTPSLLGRKGEPGELPPVSSLPVSQDIASGIVPPLAGTDFLKRWGGKTAKAGSQALTKDTAVAVDSITANQAR